MRELAFQIGLWAGFGMIIGAVIVGNVAYYNLNRAVNKAYGIRHRVSPWAEIFLERPRLKQVMERVRLYRDAYGNGVHWKRLKLAYWMVGLGVGLLLGNIILRNKF